MFLVVDGWSTLRADFDDLEQKLQPSPSAASTSGCTCSGGRPLGGLPLAMRDIFGTRLELRLGDPLDSEIDRKVGGQRADRPPGPRHLAAAALPRRPAPDRRSTRARHPGRRRRDLIRRSAAAWQGPAGPSCACCPAGSARPGPAQAGDRDRRLLLGIDEKSFAPVGLDLATDPHLLVLGDGRVRQVRAAALDVDEIVRTRSAEGGPDHRWSTTGGRCSARSPRTTSSTTSPARPRRRRR